MSLSSALKNLNGVGDQVRPMLSRVILGINRNTETKRHSQGSSKRISAPLCQTVVLGLILFCEEWCNRRASKRQATELNNCCSSLHLYPLFCFFRFEREAKHAVEACGKMMFWYLSMGSRVLACPMLMPCRSSIPPMACSTSV